MQDSVWCSYLADYSNKRFLSNTKEANNFDNLKSAFWRNACIICFQRDVRLFTQ